ncbi:putative oxygenase MesX, partial [Enterobacter bugandensis]|uniref:putative oxygenase MesX n=1 Tax=Enterobacter bugandensis TaxID=881260 RepID=UPI002E2E8083
PNTLGMINNRLNALASWDIPTANRYAVELKIISVDLNIGAEKPFPAIAILQTYIVDKKNNKRIAGIVGNKFSSYVWDYDFSV